MNTTALPPISASAFTQFREDLDSQGYPAPSPEVIQFFYALSTAGYRFHVPAPGYWYDFKVDQFRLDFVTAQTGANGLYHVDPAQLCPQVFNYNQRFDRMAEYVVVACWNSMTYRLDFYMFDAEEAPTSFGANDAFAAAGLGQWEMFCQVPAKLAEVIVSS